MFELVAGGDRLECALRNVLERAAILADEPMLRAEHFSFDPASPDVASIAAPPEGQPSGPSKRSSEPPSHGRS